MARISESFTLWKGACSDGLFIQPAGNPGQVMVCNKERGVLKYDISEKRLIQSWPLPQKLSVTSMSRQANNEYSFVFNKKSLCKWTEEILNPLDGQIDDLGIPSIYRHHPVAIKNMTDTAIVTDTGVGFLYSSKGNIGDKLKNGVKGDRCLYSTLVSHKDMKLLIIICEGENQGFYARIYTIAANDPQNTGIKIYQQRILVLTLSKEVTHIVSCCMMENPLRLIILGTDGILYGQNMEESILNEDVTSISFKHQQKVVENTNNLGDLQCLLVEVDKDYVALVRQSEKSPGRGVVDVYSTKFVGKVGEHEFVVAEDGDKRNVKIFRAKCVHGHLVISTSHSLVACVVSLEKPSLANVLGTGTMRIERKARQAEEPTILSKKVSSRKSSSWNDFESSKDPQKAQEQLLLLRKLASSSECPDAQSFTEILTSFVSITTTKSIKKLRKRRASEGNKKKKEDEPMEEVNTKKEEDDVEKENGVKKDGDSKKGDTMNEKNDSAEKEEDAVLEKKPRISSCVEPQPLLDIVVERLISDADVWSENLMEHLIRKRLISLRHQKAVIQHLMQRNSLKLLGYVFKMLRGIHEPDLVSCLRYALKFELSERKSSRPDGDNFPALQFNENGKSNQEGPNNLCMRPDPEPKRLPFSISYDTPWSKDTDGQHLGSRGEIKCPVSDKVAPLLGAILAATGNEFTLEKHLQVLTIEETEVLLELLGYLVRQCYQPYKRQYMAKGSSFVHVSHDQVIDWITCVINAQFTSIILSPKLKQLLTEIQCEVRHELRTEHCLDMLQPLLHQLEGKKYPQKRQKALYESGKIIL